MRRLLTKKNKKLKQTVTSILLMKEALYRESNKAAKAMSSQVFQTF